MSAVDAGTLLWGVLKEAATLCWAHPTSLSQEGVQEGVRLCSGMMSSVPGIFWKAQALPRTGCMAK